MRSRRLRILAKSLMFVLFILLLSSEAAAVGRDGDRPELVYDDSGRPLNSLFEGVPPSQVAKEFFVTLRPPISCQRPSADHSLLRWAWSSIADWIKPADVRAASADDGCDKTPCGGHFTVFDQRACLQSCGGGFYTFHFSDPFFVWASGWCLTGCVTCAGCVCEEGACTNP